MRVSYLKALLLILTPVLIFFFSNGEIHNDEGYILNSAEKILQGLLPYRDFHFVYTPLSVFITSLSFLIFKTSILSSRILMFAISLGASYFIYQITFIPTKNKLYATIAVLVFIAWGPTHINFVWPTMIAIFTGLLTCFLLLKFLDKRHQVYLFFAGLTTFSVFLAEQNFGLAVLFAIAVFFLIKNSRNIEYFLTFLYGYAWGLILFSIYLLLTGSYPQFIQDMFVFTYLRTIEIPQINFLFILPILFSIAAFILLFIRRRFHLLFLLVFVLSFYLTGFRPLTNSNFMIPLICLMGIPIALVLRYNISTNLRFIILFISALLLIVGFYTVLNKNFKRFDRSTKSRIFISDQQNNEFDELRKIVNNKSTKGDFIYVNVYNPMIYFITDRKEPTKNNFLLAEIDSDKYYKEVLGNLIAKDVKLIFINHGSVESLPFKKFLLTRYKFIKTIQNVDVFGKIN